MEIKYQNNITSYIYKQINNSYTNIYNSNQYHIEIYEQISHIYI